MAVAVVAHHLHDDVGYHLLQFGQELVCVILPLLYLPEFALPDASQFGTLEQFFVDDAYQFHSRGRCPQRGALLADVATAEQGFYDCCACRGAAYAVLLQRVSQFLVLHHLSCRFHGAEQCRFGVWLWRCGLLFGKVRGVRSAFALDELGQQFLVGRRVGRFCVSAPEYLPGRVGDVLSRGAESDVAHLARYGGSLEKAVGIEYAYEASCYQVKDLLLSFRQSHDGLACGNDGVVVRHLAVVEELLVLPQFLPLYPVHQVEVFLQPVHYLSALGIHVVGQEGGVHTGIRRYLLLVEALHQLQCLVSRVSEFPVALHLQACQVEQARRCLLALLLLYLADSEGQVLYLLQYSLALLACLETLGSLFLGLGLLGLCGLVFFFLLFLHHHVEHRVAVQGGQYPVGGGHEVLYLLLASDNEGEGRGLHTAYAQHLVGSLRTVVAFVFQCVKSGGVHAKGPVSYGTHQSCLVQALVVRLVLQGLETFTYRLFRQRGNPQALHGTLGSGQLHHPSLYQFSLLAGITAVYDGVGVLHQRCYHLELVFHPLVLLQAYAEAGRYHGQGPERPILPLLVVFVRFLQFAQVAEGPCHLIPVALHVSVSGLVGTEHLGYVLGHRGLLGNADYHAVKTVMLCKAKGLSTAPSVSSGTCSADTRCYSPRQVRRWRRSGWQRPVLAGRCWHRLSVPSA